MRYLKPVNLFTGYFIVLLLLTMGCLAEKTSSFRDECGFSDLSGFESLNANQFLVINTGDSVVFDFSQAICTPAYVQVPVFFLSDDVVYAVDFALKFNPSEFSYNSFINHKPYLNNSMSFNFADSTLRFSTFSMTPIDNNSPLISVRFNVASSMIGISSFSQVQTWLNGDDCSFKSVNLPAAPPIVPGGITSIAAGDSVSLSISPPAGHSFVWSTGATLPSIWVYNAGTYSVAVTNPAGCTSTSYINISSSNPLPVELLQFEGSDSNAGNVILWTTATEVNNDYFILEHSVDAVSWKFLVRMNGAGTSDNMNFYEFIHMFPHQGYNYYRLRQYDYDGSERISDAIAVNSRLFKSEPKIVIYPNPSIAGINELTISVTSVENSGVLSILDLSGKVLLSEKINIDMTGTIGDPIVFKLQNIMPPGVYSVKWSDAFNVAVTRLVVY